MSASTKMYRVKCDSCDSCDYSATFKITSVEMPVLGTLLCPRCFKQVKLQFEGVLTE